MAYLAVFAVVFVLIALLAIGDALASGLLAYAVVHVLRQRPKWYVGKILKGGIVGAVAGAVLSLPLVLPVHSGLSDDNLFILVTFVLSGFGWTALEPACWYWRLRLERNAPI